MRRSSLTLNAIQRLVQLGVEIVNPKFVEVAQHDVRRAVRDEVEPVIEGLLVVFGEFFAARFHFDQHAARPDEIGEFGVLAGKADAIFERGTFRQGVGVVVEGFEQMEQERLRLAFFVAFEFGGERRRNRGSPVPARSWRGLCAGKGGRQFWALNLQSASRRIQEGAGQTVPAPLNEPPKQGRRDACFTFSVIAVDGP